MATRTTQDCGSVQASIMWWGHPLVAVLTVWTRSAWGFSNGRVGVACGDMGPQHGPRPRPDPPPYSLSVDKPSFSPGEPVTVSLQALNGSFFRGFLIEARDSEDLQSPAVGVFSLSAPQQSQLLQCAGSPRSAVSHRTGSRKTHIQAVWRSDRNPPHSVQFLVTVVQDYQVYWVRITGPLVVLRGATESPSTAPPASPSSPAVLSAPFSSEGCGLTKSCLREPEGCRPDSDHRCVFLSFTADASGRSVMFELSGPAEGYVSFALSLDKWMGNDDVFLCVKDGGGVSIRAGYVSGRTQPELHPQESLWGGAWRLENGLIQCRFHRNSVLPPSFSFNHSLFVFLACGGAHGGSVLKHQEQPVVSGRQTVISGPPEDLRGSRPPLLIRLHGVLMLTAWMWTASCGVLAARHCKHLWSSRSRPGHTLWFQLHRTLMVLALVLTAVGFTLPFLYRRGWSKSAGSHSSMGCAVLTLSVLQGTSAWFRPAPQSPRRVFFRWTHLAVGSITHLLAVVCVFQGPALQTLLLPRPWYPAGLSAWLLWILLTDLLLQLHAFLSRIRDGNRTRSEEQENIISENQQQAECWSVRKTMLLLFLLGHSIFLAAFTQAVFRL
ncbi:putative ferric-chelate reductase 1 [Salarias fasciatus]|uniref:putative ferric-chelate reductase 1 n=1 Tax=Salarias fasciatus TaxID=181472 RepID=UPI001176E5CD|nr:ferric-chelate reductase 1 [Salarias fasciatus]